MAQTDYVIKFSSSDDSATSGAYTKAAITIGEKAVDNTTTSLRLHGKYSTDYAQDIWTGMVRLLENFSRSTPPSNSIMGQLWFDSATQTLKVYKAVSTSPTVLDYAALSPFVTTSTSITASLPLLSTTSDNGIQATGDYSKYFTTKGYADDHYFEIGNYANASKLSKYKIKYNTSISYTAGDEDKYALVTREYVDSVSGSALPVTVTPGGSTIKFDKPIEGMSDNGIPPSGGVPDGDDSDYNDYFITRGYADKRYIREGRYSNTLLSRQITTKIKYNSQVTYDGSPITDADKYTLVHKGYVDYVVQKATEIPDWVKNLNKGILISDGTSVSEYSTNATNKVLVTNATGYEWKDMPSSVAPTTAGVVTSTGTALSSTAYGANDFILASSGTGLKWVNPTSLGGSPTAITVPTTAGVVTSNGTALGSVANKHGVFVYTGTKYDFLLPTAKDQVLTCTDAATGAFSWAANPISAWAKAPTEGIVVSDGTNLSSTGKGAANSILGMDSIAGGYTWIDPTTLGGGTKPDTPATEVVKSTAISNNGSYGYAVAVSKDGTRLVAGAPNAVVYGRRRGVAYVFVWKNDTWVEEGKLVASNAFDLDSFGYSVDINADGTRVIIGAPLADYGSSWDSGGFYIFRRLPGTSTWTEELFITGGSGGPQDTTGTSVAISDDGMTIAIGSKDDDGDNAASNGSFMVYYMSASGNPGTWAGLSGTSDRHIVGGPVQSQVYFGSCIGMDSAGSRYVCGGWGYEKTGKTYGTGSGIAGIYVASGSTFVREAWLYPITSEYVKNGEFGWDVSMNADGSRVVISSLMGVSGTPSVPYSGAVYVFVRNDTTWTQEAKLEPDVIASYSGYGYSVAINDDGDKILVGAVDESVSGSNMGVTYVFTKGSTNLWAQTDKLIPSDGLGGDNFGTDVAMSGTGELIVVGSQYASVAGVSGAGKIYTFGSAPSGPALSQLAILYAPVPAAGNKFGASVALSGDGKHMVVGVPYATYLGKTSGVAHVYDFDTPGGWTQKQIEFPSDGAAGDLYGFSTAMSANGEYIVIGAYGAPAGTAAQGTVYVLKRTATGGYTEEKIIKYTGSGWLGYSVDISNDGSTIIAGAPYTTSQTGSAYIFTMAQGGWSAGYTVVPITNAVAGDLYGYSVAINSTGDKAIVGAVAANSNGLSNCGAATIWNKTGAVWTALTQIVAGDGKASANFGWSVAINASGNRVAIGASNADIAGRSNTGAVYVYDQNPTIPGVWLMNSKLAPSILDAECNYGSCVRMNSTGNKLIIGAFDTDLPGGLTLGGMAYVHTYDPAELKWTRNAINASDKAVSMNYGASVAISDVGDIMAVGATGAKTPSKLTNAGGVYLYTQ